MKNRYGADGITYDSIMDTSIGKIEINEDIFFKFSMFEAILS